ncbi:DUF420 domain-containing protein [Paenibacillus thermoaerophilus]|jgi:putative membrane protein|uniref:DUF420 domain-containing protein n=1 Tax=Paenibacillus thermoaerophilus TaxID=1215385 RepID=A0ABW2V037_9BACL|nr:DUF420 domain-containing protein [Paenibacillus thermoaerophilus]TMV18225.1 DUF420 domain-containing protein [Paenibacillus thermoaerophilus]
MTIHEILPLVSTSFIVLSAICVAVGWVLIAQRKIKPHQKWMNAAAIFATIFFIVYVLRTSILGSTPFNGPESLKNVYLAFLLFHIVLATIGGVMGLVTLRYAYKNMVEKHRKIGPKTSIVWFCTAITGVTVYYLLYVKYPGGETKPLLDAIFG